MRWAQCLLADWNYVVPTICRVMHKDKSVNLVSMHPELRVENDLQFIGSVGRKIISCIKREAEISSSAEANLVAIHKNRSFVIHSSKVEQNSSSRPR